MSNTNSNSNNSNSSSNDNNNNNNNNNNSNKNGSKKLLSDAEVLTDLQALKAASDTLKRNPKMELSKNELLKLLSYFEGELQARDVVIAALKSEKLKHMINLASYEKKVKPNDPYAALFRDNLAMSGNMATHSTSAVAAQSEYEMRCSDKQHLESLCQQVDKQRLTHLKMISMLKEDMEKYKKMVGELEEEKRKNENAPVQQGEATTCLEVERQRLKKEVDDLRAAKEQLENTLKSQQESFDAERNNHKQIVLFLLAERKKIVMKYIEERKRSEDLAQILSEEKQRVDSIAEGLEEESKKSLRMEAELEKQTQTHEHERKMMMLNLAIEEKKVKEIEAELNRLRLENDALKKSQPLSPRLMQQLQNDSNLSTNPMVSSVAKVVQPTATVSSVPVSGPTTGIARSISPGQCLRQPSLTTIPNSSDTIKAAGSKVRIVPIAMQGQNPGSLSSVENCLNNGNLGITGASPVPTSGTLTKQSTNPPQPPIKKSTLQSNMARGVPPPIPPNKPIINKPNAAQPPSRMFMQANSTASAAPAMATPTTVTPATAAANSSQKDSTAQLMDYDN